MRFRHVILVVGAVGLMCVVPALARPSLPIAPQARGSVDLFEGKPLRVAGGVMAALLEKPMSGTVLLNCHMCHFHGTVVLAAVIASTGRIVKLQVVSGPAMLRGAAIDAVRQWRYRPYLLNGSPVAVQTTIVVPVDGEGD